MIFNCKQGLSNYAFKTSEILNNDVNICIIKFFKLFEQEFFNGVATTSKEVSMFVLLK